MSGDPFRGGPFGVSSGGGPAEALRAAAESGDVDAAKAQLALSTMSKQLIDSVDAGYFGGTARGDRGGAVGGRCICRAA
jgi:hypothetical protein